MVYPSTSLINRSIAGPLYELHLNSIGEKMKDLVDKDLITPEKLYETTLKMMRCINKEKEFLDTEFTPQDFFDYLKHHKMYWIVKPYDPDVTISESSLVGMTTIAENELGWKRKGILKEGININSPHCVGDMFLMELKHDDLYGTSGISIPKKDSRNFIEENSTSKKDGRTVYVAKAIKMSILAIYKILFNLSNESANILFKDDSIKMFGTHELITSVGFNVGTDKTIKNRTHITSIEEFDDQIMEELYGESN